MPTAEKYRPNYSVEDYLEWEGDWELWHGIPVSMSPAPNFEHQRIAAKLIYLISIELNKLTTCKKCVVVGETDWKVSNNTIVRPDVLITCDPAPPQHLLSPPVFISEILSPSTSDKDLTAKRNLYQENSVRYYLIVAPQTRSCEMLELSTAGKYESGSSTDGSSTDGPVRLTMTPGCSIELNLRDLF